MTPLVFYFGCESTKYLGHHLYRPDWWVFGNPAAPPIRAEPPRTVVDRIDGIYCRPPDLREAYGTGPQRQSSGFLEHIDGWTVLSVWDRSADKREGSNSAFVVEGEYDLVLVQQLARAAFPAQYDRIVAAAPILVRAP